MANTVTNANGIIAQAAQAQMEASKPKKPGAIMQSLLDNEQTKKILRNALHENADSYAASILDLYNSDKALQQCQPKLVFGECLKAVSLKLPINKQLGFACVVAYKGIPQFQIGYKGLIQLCMRTGQYKHINAGEVYEGEYQGYSKLTGELDISGERTSDKVIGYFAYLETLNGFTHSMYWTKEEVERHAKKYSKSFSYSSSAWKTDFDKMAVKTMLRNLLSHYGYMSVEMMNAFSAEEPKKATEETSAQDDDIVDVDATVVDTETGEVTEQELFDNDISVQN